MIEASNMWSAFYHQMAAISRFAIKNLKRWRWRHLTIVLLVALSFILYVLFSSSLEVASARRLKNTELLETKYYDAKLYLTPEDPPLVERIREAIPTGPWVPGTSVFSVGASDKAAEVVAKSIYGELTLLGLAHGNRGTFLIPFEEISGREIQGPGEILLPRSLAQDYGLTVGNAIQLMSISNARPYTLEVEIVGLYDDNFDLPPCLIDYSDALMLLEATEPNCYLFKASQITSTSDALGELLAYLRKLYPQARIVHNLLPLELAGSLQASTQQLSGWLLLMIFVFSGIAMLTIALMTFLERRKELATLKSIGLAQTQTLQMIGLEYGFSETIGILSGLAVVLYLCNRLQMLQEIAAEVLNRLMLQSMLGSLLIFVLALVFPVLTSLVASVNQLLFARTIPLLVRRIDYVPLRDTRALRREDEQGIVLLKLPEVMGEIDCLVLREVGATIKRGETLAVLESWGGLYVQEWVSRCDGTIVELDTGGYLAILPEILPD